MRSSSSSQERPEQTEGIVSLRPQARQPLELTVLAFLALQAVPIFFAQLSGTPPFPLPMLGFHLLIVRKAVYGKGLEGEGEGRVSTVVPCYRNHSRRAGEGKREWPDTADRAPKNSPPLTSREDLAISEVQVHITSTGVRGVGTLGSGGP